VTEKHIVNGVRSNPKCCAVALALSEAGLTDPRVGPLTIAVGDGLMESPPEVRGFVARFDRGQPVEAFEFELPEGVADL
jgi:hypothetical protein